MRIIISLGYLLLAWWFWLGCWIFLAQRETTAASSDAKGKKGRWLLIAGLILQPLFYLGLFFSYPTLMYVSIWVVQGPVAIFLITSLVAPFVYVRPFSARHYLRGVGIGGWLFVATAFVWVETYWILSKQDGTPVSWTQVQGFDHVRQHP